MTKTDEKTRGNITPALRTRTRDGDLVELLYDPKTQRTSLAVYRDGRLRIADSLDLNSGERLVPVSANNNLIRHEALLLPETAEPYGSAANLLASIAGYIHRYVDLTQEFRQIASHYVLLTWVHDAFNELPYLRLRGDFGSGKTRALTVIGSICYRPFFANGASTVSPIFHTLDSFGGTLVLDEADFRFSDAKSELVKILNNGNIRGFPVLRTAMTPRREFDPRAFQVFGPKIVAMRQSFEDVALESRFLTEEMGQRRLRDDIPINLPDSQREEATAFRNKLLMYRFEHLEKMKIDDTQLDPGLSARQNQILLPLLSLAESEIVRHEIRRAARCFEAGLFSERSSSMEGGVLEILLGLLADAARGTVSVAEIAAEFRKRHGEDYDKPITNRQIGGILRRKLRLTTWKSHGVYVVPATEKPKVVELAARYGIEQKEPELPDGSEAA
jgi:hypothetical protein